MFCHLLNEDNSVLINCALYLSDSVAVLLSNWKRSNICLPILAALGPRSSILFRLGLGIPLSTVVLS